MVVRSVAVVDDQPETLEFLAKAIKTGLLNRNIQATVACFTNSKSLLFQENCYNFDAYFLDISLADEDGISLALHLREKNNHVPIVFVSGKENRVFDSFNAHPLRFWRKRAFHEELPLVLSDVAEILCKKPSEKICLKIGDSFTVLPVEEIQYIESNDKTQIVVDLVKRYEVRQTMKYFENILKNHGFVRAHRYYLVNCNAIRRIDGTRLLMDNQDELTISRYRLTEVKKVFLENN